MSDRPVRGVRGALVYLRPREPGDAEMVHSWYEDTRIATLMGDLPRSLAFRRHRYDAVLAEEGSNTFFFVICRLEDDLPVGRLDLFSIDRQNGSAAFGLAIGDPAMWGKGSAPTPSMPSWTSPSDSSDSNVSGSTPMPTTPELRRSTRGAGSVVRASSVVRSTRTVSGATTSGWPSSATSGWP